jgi:hypothetical protein
LALSPLLLLRGRHLPRQNQIKIGLVVMMIRRKMMTRKKLVEEVVSKLCQHTLGSALLGEVMMSQNYPFKREELGRFICFPLA